jgi:hypothetical protein
MCLRAKSSPSGGNKGGIIGIPFSKNTIGDCTGSNFEGAHHLYKAKGVRVIQNMMATKQNKFQEKGGQLGKLALIMT